MGIIRITVRVTRPSFNVESSTRFLTNSYFTRTCYSIEWHLIYFLSLERYRLLPLTAVERSSDIPASLLFDNCSLENLAYVRSGPYDVLGLITLGRYYARAPTSGRPGPCLQSALRGLSGWYAFFPRLPKQ